MAGVSAITRLLRRVGRVGHPYHAPLRCLVSSVNEDAHPMRSKPIGTDEVGSKIDGKVKTLTPQSTASTGNKYNPKGSKGV